MEIAAGLVAWYLPSSVEQWGWAQTWECTWQATGGGKEKKKQKKEDVQVRAERVSGGRMGRSDRLREKRTDCRKTRQLLDRRSPHSITSDQPHITHLIYLPLLLSASPLPLSFLLLFTSPSPLCPLGPWLPCRVGALRLHSQHYVLAQAGSVKHLLWLIVV